MTCSCLQCFSVLHHRLECIRDNRSSEFIVFRFRSEYRRNRHEVHAKIVVDIEHLPCFVVRFLCACMGGMSFLPKEFSTPQKQSCPHFPSDDIRPLIYQQRQITIGMDPILIAVPYDGFRGRSHDELFFKLRFRIDDDSFPVRIVHQSIMGHYCAFFGKVRHMFSFLIQK